MGSKSKKLVSKIRVTLVRSAIGYPQKQKDTVRRLGLRRMHQSIEHEDSPAIRGMLAKVSHLVQVEEQVKK